MSQQINEKLSLAVPSYDYDGLKLDLYAEFSSDDFEVAAVTVAGTKVDISALLSASQLRDFEGAIERQLLADERDERFDRVLSRVGPVLLGCAR